MQRHRSQGGAGSSESKSMVITRSRSHSASSSRTTNTGSSSSDSSSSASSSSSSSGSGSDSSSSDTEASRASKSSQQSRESQSSQKNVSTSKPATKTVPNTNGKTSTKVQVTASTNSSTTRKKNGSVPPSQSSVVQKTVAVAAGQSKNVKSRVITSGTVKNIKPQAINKMVHRSINRKKSLIGSSSESELSSAITSPVKRVGSKPVAVSIITSKSPVSPAASTSSKKKSVPVSNSNHASKSSSKQAAVKKSTNAIREVVPSSTKKKSSSKKMIMKSIFSPENSSEDSESEKPPPRQPSKKSSSTTNSKKAQPTLEKSDSSVDKNKKSRKRVPSPAPNPVSSSSLSASGTGTSSNTSSSASSSDSSSESEKKPESTKVESDSAKGDASPKSPSSSGRKRPVTRRQRRNVSSKTIPTTTAFNQSPSVFTEVVRPQPQLTLWDSDYSASDDHEARSHARVPAKGSHKTKPRPTDDDEDCMMERERKCPFPCCDSSGHLSGKFPTHSMLSTCPKYQGFSPEECKENAEERESREVERLKYFNAAQPHQKRPSKLSQEGKVWVSKIKDLKERQTKDGLCSEYDMTLWVDALAVAAGKIETEQAEGISYRSVAVGKFEMSCWCDSPYPEPLSHSRRLFICEFCLKPVQSGTVLRRHCAKCVWRHPPGDEIYRKDRLSVWEVDGKNQKTYCQNLCLLAKCFLDHKTLYLDVDPFLFYVMTLADSQGCHLVGYFSKEKNSFLNYNVSCILTLPPYQRQGFGRLLIDFSYLLTRVEGKVGSPEKPLSDLGLISYRSYWKDAVLCRMCSCATREMIVKDLSIELGVTSADLISTLQFLGMLKYWKGKHIVLKKQDVLEEYTERLRKKGETRQIDPTMLRWRPYQPPAETSS